MKNCAQRNLPIARLSTDQDIMMKTTSHRDAREIPSLIQVLLVSVMLMRYKTWSARLTQR